MKSKDDHTETVKLLLNYGANANARNARGETPLHLATRNEFQKVIEVLVLAGCDPTAEDRDGNKPIDLTSDDDAVSKQTLLHAAENRERYLNESAEVRARGFSTTTQGQAALPLSIQSPSLFSMPMLLGAAPGLPMLTRAASTPGLFASPPQSAIPFGMTTGGLMAPFGSRGQLAAMTQASGSMSPTSLAASGVILNDGSFSVDGFPPSQLINRQFSLQNGSQLGVFGGTGSRVIIPSADLDTTLLSTSMHVADDAQSVVSAVPSLPNFYSLRRNRCPSEESSLWEVTPLPSINSSNLDVRDDDSRPSRRRRVKRKVVKPKADVILKPNDSPPRPTDKPAVAPRPKSKPSQLQQRQQQQQQQQQQQHSSSSSSSSSPSPARRQMTTLRRRSTSAATAKRSRSIRYLR
jgi:hypothetical protein